MSNLLPVPFDERNDLLLGSPAADAKLVWYIDYSGERTRRNRQLLLDVTQQIGNEDAVIAIRPFGTKETGQRVARAVAAAGKQGRFAEMHLAMIGHTGGFSEDDIVGVAEKAGLDIARFRQDWTSNDVAVRVNESTDQIKQIGTAGTGLFIDGRRYEGVWDEQSVVEAIQKPFGYRIRAATLEFFHWAASAGLVLVLATLAALAFVNVGYHETYEHLCETPIGVSVGESTFRLSAEHWVNDGLMAIFFLLVGIEIKREIVNGELSTLSRAMLPVFGALGGMVVPALIYVAINLGHESIAGWGVPMATDIAFTLGLMALLGSRVPTSLTVFVSALAIADDLGAILVIAIFYGEGFQFVPFIWAIGIFASMFVLNVGKVYARVPYLVLGAGLWFMVHESGLHATLAGVLTAVAIPSRKSGNLMGVAAQTAALFESEMRTASKAATGSTTIGARSLKTLHSAVERLREPGFHLQHALESWTNFLILPLFAFFNMGIVIFGAPFDITTPESLGVIAGLMIGKPLGIALVCWLAVKAGLAKLAPDVTWTQMIGAGCLAGVGFTMSIFIGTAAFEGRQLQSVKLSILIASTLAAVIGMAILYQAKPRNLDSAR